MKKPFILVVDDNRITTKLLRRYLEANGFLAKEAYDGVDCLEKVEEQIPDTIVLDVMMPRLDGFGVIEQLRANHVTQDLPIIVISAKELTDEESARLKESVTFVMGKQGFDGEKLVQEIRSVLNEQS